MRSTGRRPSGSCECDILGITRRKRRYLTAQDAEAAPAPDLLGRDFIATKPGTKPIGGSAYLPTIEGRWCPATVIEQATGR
ncbi:hypothetical protein ACWGQ5_40460 [Streptomyces sp. NPDC055722]